MFLSWSKAYQIIAKLLNLWLCISNKVAHLNDKSAAVSSDRGFAAVVTLQLPMFASRTQALKYQDATFTKAML